MRFKSDRYKPRPELVVSTDKSRPVLSKVHLNAEASMIEVTDSYMLARFPVELDEGDTTGPVPVDALKASRKPPLRGEATSIRCNSHVEVQMETATEPYVTFPREAADYQFPDCGRLIPENLSDFEIGLDAELLFRLAKAMGDKRVRLRFTNTNTDEGGSSPSPLRPIVVRPIDAGEDDPTGLLMPVRIAR